MRVAILHNAADLSAYVGEILGTWGLPIYDFVEPEALAAVRPDTTPVVIAPASDLSGVSAASLVAYAERGGTLICFLPKGRLAAAAGIASRGPKESPLRLRVTGMAAAGLAGELLPVVGPAEDYDMASDATALAYLCHPGEYRGESVGIIEAAVGQGRIVAFAFDLPRCVLLLRQGDPQTAEAVPPGDTTARPSHLAADIGPRDAGWTPFADMMSRLLFDLVRRHLPVPVPTMATLPGAAQGVLLYSGDEDGAEVAWNDTELDYVAEAGARMNLYIIPVRTQSSAADVERYASRHDVGPHPMLSEQYGCSVAERVQELERQVRLFEDMFGRKAKSLRNHSTAWAGYLELVEAMERLGVKMDANYCSGGYMRARDASPYGTFGAAMPMRFCRPDGRLIDVFQQHTHLSDDSMFGPHQEYSYKLTPEAFAAVASRIFDDMVTRFHTPFGVCIHPSNWVRFSRVQGEELLRQGAAHDIPIWSFDQWLGFWEARDSWTFTDVRWHESELRFVAQGRTPHDALSLVLPLEHDGQSLREVRLGDASVAWQECSRYRESVALVPVPADETAVCVRASYS